MNYWNIIYSDIKQHIYTYMHFYEIKNSELISKHFISKSLIKQQIRDFIKKHTLLKEKKTINYYLQIYYERTLNCWDYINVCSCKDVHLYITIKKRFSKSSKSIYDSEGSELYTQESLVIYNNYTKKCYIQNQNNFI
jgi:hypothetical protein